MRVIASLSFSFVVAACASSPAPAPTSSTPAGSASAAPATASDKAPEAKTRENNEAAMESHRESFMQMCTKKVPAPDYCDCAWGEFKQIFKGEDLSKELPTEDPRFAALQERTANNCANKLPEATLQKVYIEGCSKNDKKRLPHCECEWATLRKRLALADFVRLEAQSSSPRLMEARAAIPKECKGKMPKDLIKSDFLVGCTQNDASRSKVCECAWKKVSAKYSPEEIHAGVADLEKVPGLDECRAMSAPPPAAPPTKP